MTDDQTTPDTERAERLAEAREFASTSRSIQFPPHTIGSLLLALDDEITRLTGLLAARDATVQRVRDALARHPRACTEHAEHDAITCGWKRAVADVQHALDPQEPTS